MNRLRIYCTTVAITAHKFRYSNHKHHSANSCWQFLLFSIIQLKERYASSDCSELVCLSRYVLVFHFLVQLRPRRDVVIHHQKMKLFLPVALVDRREQLVAGNEFCEKLLTLSNRSVGVGFCSANYFCCGSLSEFRQKNTRNAVRANPVNGGYSIAYKAGIFLYLIHLLLSSAKFKNLQLFAIHFLVRSSLICPYRVSSCFLSTDPSNFKT